MPARATESSRTHAAAVNVLVVDDSAVVRQVLTGLLQSEASIRVVAAVADPILAMHRMRILWPDVVVLDVEMPRMDGLTFLRKIMAERPTPVVICSALTTRGAETTMRALAAGAVSVIAKPQFATQALLLQSAADLVEAVKSAAAANTRNLLTAPAAAPREAAPRAVPSGEPAQRVLAIGASTGGTQALEATLSVLPRTSAAILVVQHMPEKFTGAFAARLDSLSGVEVLEARDGDPIVQGRAYIAPGGKHMSVAPFAGRLRVSVRDGPLVNHHRPSVDVLFHSVAQHVGRNAMGIVMTGMGNDGARGLLAMRKAGAPTVAQDEASCVVFGMPKEAIRLGAAGAVLPLAAIAEEMARFGTTA